MASPPYDDKVEPDSDDDQYLPRSESQSPAIPIAGLFTANENWRGRSDPAVRRRIQNRLNQRAFRQRQRSGDSTTRRGRSRRAGSSSASRETSEDIDVDMLPLQLESSADTTITAIPPTPTPTSPLPRSPSRNPLRPTGALDPQTDEVWDELARLINANFMAAALSNARQLGIDASLLQTGTTHIATPRIAPSPQLLSIPSALTPVEIQYQLPHDPIIDTIPHARLRLNIMNALATAQLDAAAFSQSLRASGALLEQRDGIWQRGGVVVWGPPAQLASWELSEPFARRWAFLLVGCEHMIAGTNAWRAGRGEAPLSFV
ncbi:hypothetical protein BDY17DRAFT_321564 [Neohortaea acidophila]|uniref:BZIP domain-containing protein n=1 Tax=Neohortaea acidophila TaxID=245834 RepID=A0A6A6Q417_9PEZI|nr:uncharacterized protein BDY17DRAFT_321564 [Neohortaea acidophila]KAF2486801.1 hypothetical protein BDY17DRAFT_321564 [Neohortaea acidophila]